MTLPLSLEALDMVRSLLLLLPLVATTPMVSLALQAATMSVEVMVATISPTLNQSRRSLMMIIRDIGRYVRLPLFRLSCMPLPVYVYVYP